MSSFCDKNTRVRTQTHQKIVGSNSKRPFEEEFSTTLSSSKRSRYGMRSSTAKTAESEDKIVEPNNGSSLMNLPIELRLRIMEELLFDNPSLTEIHQYHEPNRKRKFKPVHKCQRMYHPLYLTCKSLSYELDKIRLENAIHVFHHQICQDHHSPPNWLTGNAPLQTKEIKVIFEYDEQVTQFPAAIWKIDETLPLLLPIYHTTFSAIKDIPYEHHFHIRHSKIHCSFHHVDPVLSIGTASELKLTMCMPWGVLWRSRAPWIHADWVPFHLRTSDNITRTKVEVDWTLRPDHIDQRYRCIAEGLGTRIAEQLRKNCQQVNFKLRFLRTEDSPETDDVEL